MPYGKGIIRTCAHCDVVFVRKQENAKSVRHFCCKDHYYAHNRGEAHCNFAGGRWFSKDKGYWMVTDGKGGSRPEHILKAEQVLGRKLRRDEVVHHINGDKLDNRNSNLLICTMAYHTALHQRMSMKYAAMIEV